MGHCCGASVTLVRVFILHIRVHRRGGRAHLRDQPCVWVTGVTCGPCPAGNEIGVMFRLEHSCVMFQLEHWGGFGLRFTFWRNVPTGTLWKSMKFSFASR